MPPHISHSKGPSSLCKTVHPQSLWWSLPSGVCIGYFSCWCDKIPSSREGLFWLTIQGRCPSLWGDRAMGARPIAQQSGSRDEGRCSVPFLLLFSPGSQPTDALKPLDRRGLSSSLNPIWKLPPRHTQKCISYWFEIIASWQSRQTVTMCFTNTESCLSQKCLREAAALRMGYGYKRDESLPCSEQWVQVIKSKWSWNSQR